MEGRKTLFGGRMAVEARSGGGTGVSRLLRMCVALLLAGVAAVAVIGTAGGADYSFGERRNPRTLAGVTPGGDLLLVAVDGRAPGYSVGASFEEGAAVMDALGAAEAVNLDGGGSTGMTLDERLVTRPSDTTGERPIGDAVVLLP